MIVRDIFMLKKDWHRLKERRLEGEKISHYTGFIHDSNSKYLTLFM